MARSRASSEPACTTSTVWTTTYAQTTDADPARVWDLLADVDGWVRWNDGIESIALQGPLRVGATFRMTPPGEAQLISTVVALDPPRLLTDLTELDGVAVRVEHRVDAAPAGGTTITYRVTVTGDVPDEVAEQIGRAVSADLPDVIAGLIATAGATGRGTIAP